MKLWVSLLLLSTLLPVAPAAQTAFTYQGRLTEDGSVVTDDCVFTFRLFEDEVGGSEIAAIGDVPVSVVDGLFTTELDFGDVFDGTPRWLQIETDCGSGQETLSPRRALLATPYASNALTLDGVPAGEFLHDTSNDPRVAVGHMTVPFTACGTACEFNIPIYSFKLVITRSKPTTPGGSSSGTPDIDDIVIGKGFDLFTPAMATWAAVGTNITPIVVTLYPSAPGQPSVTATFQTNSFTKYEHRFPEEGSPYATDLVTLRPVVINLQFSNPSTLVSYNVSSNTGVTDTPTERTFFASMPDTLTDPLDSSAIRINSWSSLGDHSVPGPLEVETNIIRPIGAPASTEFFTAAIFGQNVTRYNIHSVFERNPGDGVPVVQYQNQFNNCTVTRYELTAEGQPGPVDSAQFVFASQTLRYTAPTAIVTGSLNRATGLGSVTVTGP